VRHHSYVPRGPLSDLVHDIWSYESAGAVPRKERILPTGTIELVITLREDVLRIYDAAMVTPRARFSSALVSGPYSGMFGIDMDERRSVVGVHFRPGGAFPFLRVSAEELADQHVGLDALWGRAAIELRERLCAAPTAQAQMQLLEAALVARLAEPMKRHRAVSAALHLVRCRGAGLTVRTIAKEVGLSERRFIRVFATEVGVTPKRFLRLDRFHRARSHIARSAGPPDWARIACATGYFDQAHLIRDFRQFSGLSPTRYVAELSALARHGVHVNRNHLPVIAGVTFFQDDGGQVL
jgi:AraC-like DNA-binding protein